MIKVANIHELQHILLIEKCDFLGGNRQHISVMGCGNAAGQAIPPLIIFQGKYVPNDCVTEGPPSALYAATPSGHMTSELMVHWMKHFIEYVPSKPIERYFY